MHRKGQKLIEPFSTATRAGQSWVGKRIQNYLQEQWASWKMAILGSPQKGPSRVNCLVTKVRRQQEVWAGEEGKQGGTHHTYSAEKSNPKPGNGAASTA